MLRNASHTQKRGMKLQEEGKNRDFPFSGVQGVLMRDLNQVTLDLGIFLELKTYLKGE